MTAGQPLGTGGTLGTEGTGHFYPVDTITMSAANATTDPNPVKAEAQPSPQSISGEPISRPGHSPRLWLRASNQLRGVRFA